MRAWLIFLLLGHSCFKSLFCFKLIGFGCISYRPNWIGSTSTAWLGIAFLVVFIDYQSNYRRMASATQINTNNAPTHLWLALSWQWLNPKAWLAGRVKHFSLHLRLIQMNTDLAVCNLTDCWCLLGGVGLDREITWTVFQSLRKSVWWNNRPLALLSWMEGCFFNHNLWRLNRSIERAILIPVSPLQNVVLIFDEMSPDH